jgi:hypothetical protein
MTTVNITRTTNLRGRQLQDAVSGMIQELSGRSPYSLVRLSWRWVTGSEIELSAGNHMRGSVTIQDGSPSRVNAQIELLSGLAQGQRSNVIRDLNALADQRLGGAPSATGAPTAPAADQEPYASPQERQRREFDPDRAAAVTTGIFTGLTALARGITQGVESVREARQGAQTQPEPGGFFDQAAPALTQAGQQATAPPPKPGVIEAVTSFITGKPSAAQQPQSGPGFTLGPGYSVGPQEPVDVTPAAPPPARQTPWGWIALGVGAAAAATVAVVTLAGDEKEK